MTTPARAPDWYPDPSGKPGLMYWDGRQWRPDIPTASSPPDQPPPEPISTPPHPHLQTALITALLVAVVILLGFVGIASYLLLKQPHPSRTPTAQPAPPSEHSPQAAPSSSSTPTFQYFTTPSGKVCQVTAQQVTCQTCIPGQVITNAYTCTDPAPGVAVNTAGIVDHNPADIGSSF